MVIKAERKKLKNSEVKKLVGRFKRGLKKNKILFERMYVFGSYAKGRPHADSDIDVAIILPNAFIQSNKKKLGEIIWMAKQINVKLEPHLLSRNDFANRWLSLPAEIKKYGIKV